jgi:hypothetical protein
MRFYILLRSADPDVQDHIIGEVVAYPARRGRALDPDQ